MFDSIAPPKTSRRRTIFFAASGIAHGGAVAALIIVAMLRVDKLDYTREHAQIAVMPAPPAGNSGGGRAKTLPNATKVVPHKIKVTTPVQPVPHAAQIETTTTTEEQGEPGTGGGGDGKGHDQPEIGTGCLEGTACGVAEVKVPELPKPCSDPSRANDADCRPPPPPPIVVVEKLRIAGETQIQPTDDVKVMMQREGKSTLHVSFKVCLDKDGAVTSTARLGSTGYGEYDDRLAQAIAGWKYRPYSVNGTAIAVCGPVTFNFHLR